MDPLTPESFTPRVEAELRARHAGTPYEQRALIEFLQDEWQHVADDPDPALWADAFVKRERVVRLLRDGPGPLHVHYLPRE